MYVGFVEEGDDHAWGWAGDQLSELLLVQISIDGKDVIAAFEDP